MFRELKKNPLPFLSGLLVALLLVLIAFIIFKLSNIGFHNCQQIESIKGQIRHVLKGSLSQLGKKGSAGYGYYSTHLDELRAARHDLINGLHIFKAYICK